jgi:hypothetical protein
MDEVVSIRNIQKQNMDLVTIFNSQKERWPISKGSNRNRSGKMYTIRKYAV